MYLAIGIIFLIVSLLIAGIIVFTLVRSAKDSGELISKKNLFYFIPSFLLIYFLYITAACFNKEEMDLFYDFSLINTTLDTLKFKPARSLILPICKAHPIYYVDFVLAIILAEGTFILSIASFFSQRMKNFFSVRKLLHSGCDIVVGDSADAVKYVKNNKNSLLWATDVKRQRLNDLFKLKLPVIDCPFEAKAVLRKIKNGEHNIIVFRDGNYSYTKIIESFTDLIKAGGTARLHLEANQDETKIIKEKFISKADRLAAAHITCFSKYELMARRFVADYPITKYIPRSFYNPNCTVKNGKEINVVFIGFGKVNYQLFRMCTMQFQFAQEKGGRLASNPVRYHVFDTMGKALHNEFFSRILYEYDEEFKDCDFPAPEKICDLNIYNCDINSVEAKKKFRSFVSKDSFTYFIVSLEHDLEDASYAQTVRRLLSDEENYRIFVRVRNNNGEKLNGESDSVIYFGEDDKIYTHENLVNDDLTELAQRLNLLYSNIANPPVWLSAVKELPPEEQSGQLMKILENPDNRKLMLKKWAELPLIEQSSNLYHALNLPFKLYLLGFEMVKKNGENITGISEEEYNIRYVNSGRAENYSDYSFFFGTETANVLAFIEHSRWNALYILYDYKQIKKKDMHVVEKTDEKGNTVKSLPHKDTEKKRHGCITSYYGLNDLITYKYGVLYPEADLKKLDYATDTHLRDLGRIYAYDYMDLDKLYGEISAMGYVIVKAESYAAEQ